MKTVYVVDGNRTPFLKARGKPGPFAAADLAVLASRELFARLPINPDQVGEVVTGCMVPSPDEANISRIISLRLGCGDNVPAYTVQRNCASGLEALDGAFKDIQLGRHDIVLAGGTEAMSRSPLLFNNKMVNWFAGMFKAKTIPQKLAHLTKLRPGHFAPVIALLRGLRDPLCGLSMGQTAEIIADHFKISRDDMDEFALRSHAALADAIDKKHLDPIISPIIDNKGKVYAEDDGLRRDSDMTKMAKLKPFFDKKFGKVTAANSSQVTDGACFLMLADEKAVEKHKLPVMAKITDIEWAGVDPKEMGLGPVKAMAHVLKKNKISFDDIDYFEINEAFAAQVIGCLKACEDAEYCKQELGLKEPLGTIPMDKLNVDGGAVAIGHPVGASGARIVLHLINTLKRNNAKRGLASICIGGGQGGAALIEMVE